MIVPPHLAYGDHGTGDIIPGGATLIFDVRLVQMNDDWWSPDQGNKKATGWETVYKPDVCDAIVTYSDLITIHYKYAIIILWVNM